MKLLIAYDGSGYSHAILNELQRSGLPSKAEVLIISVSEVWLPKKTQQRHVFSDIAATGYFKSHGEQMERNLADTNIIVREARQELLTYFPDWNVYTEAVLGSPAREVLSRANSFQPQLIVAGARGLSSDREAGLGSISQTILYAAKCSVRISRSRPDISRSRLKLIIGFDASDESMAAVRTVALRPWKIKPEILAADALQILLEGGFSATLNIYSGNPRIILSREAQEWEADAIFIGARSHEIAQEFYSVGCVASAIASRADCSVEVLRTHLGD